MENKEIRDIINYIRHSDETIVLMEIAKNFYNEMKSKGFYTTEDHSLDGIISCIIYQDKTPIELDLEYAMSKKEIDKQEILDAFEYNINELENSVFDCDNIEKNIYSKIDDLKQALSNHRHIIKKKYLEYRDK